MDFLVIAILTFILAILKLSSVIVCSWLIVFSPLLLIIAIYLMMFLFVVWGSIDDMLSVFRR